MCFDDKLVTPRLLARFDEQIAKVGLESGVDVDLRLLDSDYLVPRCEALCYEWQELADTVTDIAPSDVNRRMTAHVIEPNLEQVPIPETNGFHLQAVSHVQFFQPPIRSVNQFAVPVEQVRQQV